MTFYILKKGILMTGLLALSLALNSCTIYIVNGTDSTGLPTRHKQSSTETASTKEKTVGVNMTDIKNSKSGLYAIVNGTTLIRCNEYYQPHNLPEDPPIPIIPPEKDNDIKFIMNLLTQSISQKTSTIAALRTKLQNEYRDILQSCLDSQ